MINAGTKDWFNQVDMGSQSLVTPYQLYQSLGGDPGARQTAYRELSSGAIGIEQMRTIRATDQTATPLGNERFREQIERALACKVGQARYGRPRKLANKGY